MSDVYGYCRISTGRQNIERQERNILERYPNAHILREIYTGTTSSRPEWNKLYALVMNNTPSDITIVFDSVSRMSRSAEEGFKLYEELFLRGVQLVFLKEPHINTETYRKSLESNIPNTGTSVDVLLEGVRKYLMILAQEQIKIAFQQSEKEVTDLHKRTSEGMKTAKLNGKQIGRIAGRTYHTKKEEQSKDLILRCSKDFNGNNSDSEVIKITGLSRNTYYKYKKMIRDEIEKM